MDAKTTVALLRCLEIGLRSAADEFERLTDPTTPYDDSFATPKYDIRHDGLSQYSKAQLVQLLASLDPAYEAAGKTIKELREQITTLVEAHADGPPMQGASSSESFVPPGIISSEDFVVAATKLTEFFEETLKTREEMVRGYYNRMGCNAKCLRPGGACPNALVCQENLT